MARTPLISERKAEARPEHCTSSSTLARKRSLSGSHFRDRPSTTRMPWSTRRNSPTAWSRSRACAGVSNSLSRSASRRCQSCFPPAGTDGARLQHPQQEIKVVETTRAGLEALCPTRIRNPLAHSAQLRDELAARRQDVFAAVASDSVGPLGYTPFPGDQPQLAEGNGLPGFRLALEILRKLSRRNYQFAFVPVGPQAGCPRQSLILPVCIRTTSQPARERTARPSPNRIPRCAKKPDPHPRARPVRRLPGVPRPAPQNPPAHPPPSGLAAGSGRNSPNTHAESPIPASPPEASVPMERSMQRRDSIRS